MSGSRSIVRLFVLVALVLLSVSAAAPLAAAPLAPTITAGNAIVLDPDTKLALFERDSHERVAPASLTKIMTALVAIEEGDLAQRVTIAREDLIGEASMGLQVGERVSLETLLYGLLLPSGNDAAMAIARAVGARPGDRSGAISVARFTGWMNVAAARLELVDSRFVNPHGLDAEGHYSSAFDLARLTGFAWQHPAFARIFGSATYQGEGHALQHGNRLIGQYEGVVGGKTGLTDGCGFCLITAARHAGHRLVVVVLRGTRAGAFTDTTALLGWSYGRVASGNVPQHSALPSSAPGAPTPVQVAPPANARVGVPAVNGAIVPTVLAGQPAPLSLPVPAVVSGTPLSAPSPTLALAIVGVLVLALLWVSRSRSPRMLG